MRYALLALVLPTMALAQKRKIEGEVSGSVFFGNTEQTLVSTRAQYERSDSGFTFRTIGRFNYGELTPPLGTILVNKRSWEAGANYDYHPFADDFVARKGEDAVDREALLKALAGFLKANKLDADWDGIEKAPNEALVNALAMMSPYGSAEKQAMLEAPDLKTRAEILVALTEIELAKTATEGETKLQ